MPARKSIESLHETWPWNIFIYKFKSLCQAATDRFFTEPLEIRFYRRTSIVLRNANMQTNIASPAADFMAGGGEMGKLMRQTDWSKTVLGPVNEWPQSLRTSVSICLNSRFPILLWWGPEMVMLYNDAYLPMLGATKHPAAMGQKGKECWPEIWHIIGPVLDGVFRKGEATWSEDQVAPLDRNAYAQECCFTFSYTPIQSENGIGGIFTAVYEKAQQDLPKKFTSGVSAQLATEKTRSHIDEQLWNVFEQTPAAIAIIARNNYVLEFANDSYLEIIDKGAESIGKSLFDILPELTNQGIKELLDNVMESGQPHLGKEFEVRLQRNEKAEGTYFNFIYHPLRYEDGNIRGVIVVCFNVTDLVTSRQRAEESELLLEQKVKERTAELQASHEAMRQQRDFVEKILNASIDNICVLDRELRYIGFNEKSVETYMKSKEEVLGRCVLEIFPEVAGSMFHISLQKALSGIPAYDQDYQSLVNGRHFEINFIPLKDQSNSVYAVLVIAHDNTGAIEAAKMLEEKNEQLSRTNRELEQFAYIASHDLQEPLRKIRTFSYLIEREVPEDFAAAKYFEKIQESSARMSGLIKDLLDYSRLSGGDVVTEEVDLANVVSNVISDYELLIEEAGARILCADLPVVKGIPHQLHQLFSNLIGNALKFAQEKPVVEVSSGIVPFTHVKKYFPVVPEIHYTEVSVKDNGIGFDQIFSEQIFTIFQRLNDRHVSGRGIGLAICRKIVENHNGFIRAEGKVGQGATFYIYFPLE